MILLLAVPAMATAQATLSVLPGWTTDKGTQMAAFEITLDPGWKTYWRSPGDAGIPPRITWKGADNLAGAQFHWPTPGVFEAGGRTIGYVDRLVLPVELSPKSNGQPMTAKGTLEIGVCEEICVPMSFRFDIAAPGQTADARITTALGDVPPTRSGKAVGGLSCRFDALADGMQVRANLRNLPVAGLQAAVLEYRDREVWVGSAEVTRHGKGATLVSDFVPPEATPFAIARDDITITLIGASDALEIRGCPAG